MSVALFIVPEREIEGFDHFVNGKYISHESDAKLNKFCKKIGVPSLYKYCSQNPDELADLIEGEGVDVPDDLPPLEWFDASEGIRTIQAMLNELGKGNSPFKNTEGVIEDLKEYENVLQRLELEGIRWHMELDF